MNVVFAGTSDFALTILRGLADAGHRILCVICQPDKPKGRKKLLTVCPVKEYALERSLPLLQPERISDPDSVKEIFLFAADVFVVAAYGQKIPSSLLHFAPLGAVNVHGSLLPQLRGAAPIQRAIMNGLKTTGVTTMLMNEGMDTGDMLLRAETPIYDHDTYGSLSGRLSDMGSALLLETLAGLADGSILPERQDDSLSTKAPSIKKEDTLADFSRSAREVYDLIRGLSPSPCARGILAGTEVRLLEARIPEEDLSFDTPGEIVSAGKEGIRVACGRGSVLITRLQPAGGKVMDAGAFANRFH
ncbi:MAG: methionyl-tRNA formyltransferase [Abditibacteriota bacterium]|nr:methionyl-tRNA formyltransferase [Abditibacteriota bacterium]